MPAFNQRIFDSLTAVEQRLYLQFDHALEFNLEQLAQVLGYGSVATIYTQRCQGTFPIPTYKKGRRVYASIRHVARYLEARENQAVDALRDNLGPVLGEDQVEQLQSLYRPDSNEKG